MKNTSFDSRLTASAPADSVVDHSFTDRVMSKIRIIQIVTNPVLVQEASKQSLFYRLRHMQKIAVFVFAVATLVLVSGTAYAVYKVLWEQPKVTNGEQTTNQFGRKQSAASLANCGNQQHETVFEVRLGNTLDQAEINKILQARCEMKTISKWSGENDLVTGAGEKPNLGTSQSSMIMLYPSASRVASISTSQLSLAGDQYAPSTPLNLTKNTQYIANGNYVTQDQIHSGDTVLFIQEITTNNTTTKNKNDEYVTSGTPTSRKITHVIKVDLPYDYYNSKQNLIAQRQECIGNIQDSCIEAQTIDLYSGSPHISNTSERRMIQGIISELNGKTMKIQSSSGRTFTVTTSTNITASFNENRSAQYNNIKVGIGDLIQIAYVANKSNSRTQLDEPYIQTIQLTIDATKKNVSTQKY